MHAGIWLNYINHCALCDCVLYFSFSFLYKSATITLKYINFFRIKLKKLVSKLLLFKLYLCYVAI